MAMINGSSEDSQACGLDSKLLFGRALHKCLFQSRTQERRQYVLVLRLTKNMNTTIPSVTMKLCVVNLGAIFLPSPTERPTVLLFCC